MARLNNAVLVVCSFSLLLFPACKEKAKTADSAVAKSSAPNVATDKKAEEAKILNESAEPKDGIKAFGAPAEPPKPSAQPRSIKDLKALKKPIPVTPKQAKTKKIAKERMRKTEEQLDKAVGRGGATSPAPRKADGDDQKGGNDVGRVAPSGNFPEEAHDLYEALCQEIDSADRLIAEYRKSKSKKIYIKAKMAVSECLMSARSIAEEYEGYPGIDDRIADLEKKEQTLAAEKP